MTRGTLLLTLAVTAGSLLARTIHVPGEAPTIQAGLDSLQDGDTVLVALGTYPEALIAPPRSFVLRGDVVPDTGDYPRPVIDPLSVPGANVGLILPAESHPIIEDLRFQNRNGIRSWATDPILRRVVMEGMHTGFADSCSSPARLEFDSCRFFSESDYGIFTWRSAVVALNCDFHNLEDGAWAWSGSSFHNCRFSGWADFLLLVSGDSISVTECEFGPCVAVSAALSIVSPQGVTVEDNVFDSCSGGSAVDALSLYANTDVLQIHGNVVRNSHVGQGHFSVFWIRFHGQACEISDNSFVNCTGQEANAILLEGDGPFSVSNNRFLHLNNTGLSALQFWDHVTDSTTQLRDNLFHDTGLALQLRFGSVDARWNWWGDSTGPYHASQNPGGRGDTIVGNVNFIPWYPDTSFLFTPDQGEFWPRAFRLESYPNPFNSSIRLTLAGFTGKDFEITLHNLLGQVVDVIHRGPLTGGELNYQAPAYLASGVYFVRATDRAAIQTNKVVLMK